MDIQSNSAVGSLEVYTSSNGGLPVSHWAGLATRKIISVGENSHPLIIEQAKEFEAHIKTVVTSYMQQAIADHIDTMVFELRAQGHNDLAEIIRRM
jgi:hypothetical protein